jgi:hypothetical protein
LRFGAARVEHGAERVVERHETGGHAGSGLEKLAAGEPLLSPKLVAHGEEPGLDLLLLLALWRERVFVA